jgi:hypothetical protein
MFNDKYGLTQAVLDGRKTMTRRICKYDRPNETYDIVFPVFEPNDYDNDGNIVSPLNYAFGWRNDEGDFTDWNIPKYKVGEVVAIAQNYRDVEQEGYPVDSRYDAFRTANWGDGEDGVLKSSAGWSNKLFVRADLMPRHIRITNIKIERLQDISDKDCLKEGIYEDSGDDKFPPSIFYEFEGNKDDGFDTPREAFAALIDKVSGKGTWLKNPYVFCYSFELID